MSHVNNEMTKEVRAAQLILDFLGNQIVPCSEKRILKMVHGRKQIKVAALRRLLDDGKVNRGGTGVRGNPFLYTLKAEQPIISDRTVVEEITI